MSALANRYGFRLVAILGSVISCGAFVLSYFSTSIEFLYISYGVLGKFLPSLETHYFGGRSPNCLGGKVSLHLTPRVAPRRGGDVFLSQHATDTCETVPRSSGAIHQNSLRGNIKLVPGALWPPTLTLSPHPPLSLFLVSRGLCALDCQEVSGQA